MSDSTISQLPPALSVSGTDLIPIDQGGVTKRATLAQTGLSSVIVAPGKTLTVNNSLTLAGTDGTTMTFPATSASIARTDASQSFTGLQTFLNGIASTTGNYSGQITSTVATGTAPLVIASTTPVANLSIGGNAGTTTALQTARNIDGISFNGTADILVVAPATHASPSKATPVAADEFTIWDSVSTLLNKVTFSNLLTTLGSTFAALAGSASQVFSAAAATAAGNVVRLDQMPQVPFRNRIVNGDMSISQVNGGTAVTPLGAANFPFDQWSFSASQNSKLTFQQVADAPAGFKYSTLITVAAQFSPGASDYFIYLQTIEGQNIIDFQLGAAGAKTIALQQWIKGSVAGTYAIAIRNGAVIVRMLERSVSQLLGRKLSLHWLEILPEHGQQITLAVLFFQLILVPVQISTPLREVGRQVLF